ncbi:MAG: (E)-4-hydroxy-3-methylbut-2-enyl-diphosphate synthase [Verrucomicrobiota bacterium]
MQYCDSLFSAQRRKTREVQVGRIHIGGDAPIRVQSMLTCDTMDTAACIHQTRELADVGCEIVRITAPTVKDAANLEAIVSGLRALGCHVPIVADIHFKPEAAMEAAKWVDKVRINPGNYADKKKFAVREYTDAEYAEELERIREKFVPLVDLCKQRSVAMRIGTNHGSLSDRIMNRYGDSPLGMVESALEFAQIARDCDYHAFVFSMKSSNPKVMISAYRLLIARLNELGPDWNYPVHLGVTEAGDGEDGRIKSAIGIGSLLADGIGDTIRVSLTEDSIHEIPVARELVIQAEAHIEPSPLPLEQQPTPSYNPFQYERRKTAQIETQGFTIGGDSLIRIALPRRDHNLLLTRKASLGECLPELIEEDLTIVAVDPRDLPAIEKLKESSTPQLVTVRDGLDLPTIKAFRLLASELAGLHPILLKDHIDDGLDPEYQLEASLDNLLLTSVVLGSLICDGIGDAILIRNKMEPEAAIRLGYNLLQAAGSRIFKTDYVACPSCGRTLFNLQDTTARIKAATAHLKGVKIAIMGCIVNGPGEMADADFGYVGGAPNKVNLYVGKNAVKFNIPEAEAVDRLKDLIREHGKWVDP